MTKLRATLLLGSMFCSAIAGIGIAAAQLALPEVKALDGAVLFRQQCATCHTVNPFDPARQGPTLSHIVGREAGKIDGFKYSAGFAQVKFVWDDSKLDAWLTNPQAVIPGAIMAYRQAKPETRAAIIAYLRGLN